MAPDAVETNIQSSMKNSNHFGVERTKIVQGIIPKVGQLHFKKK